MQATLLFALMCPLVMGAMMFFMMRSRHSPTNDSSGEAPPAMREPGAAMPLQSPQTGTRYVRNRKAHTLTFWAAGTRVTLAPRGSNGDAAALPSGAFEDPETLGCIDLGWLEEIDAHDSVARSVLRSPAGNGTRSATQTKRRPPDDGSGVA